MKLDTFTLPPGIRQPIHTIERRYGPYTERVTFTAEGVEVAYTPPLPPALKAQMVAYWRARIADAMRQAGYGGMGDGARVLQGRPAVTPGAIPGFRQIAPRRL